ncbi:MAG TPA: aldehyde ferredoxin oxidoreductase family protein [Anaerolineales bacterium]|nr:aldehyde ferredoxin oxidoreductase family protein [Anaerolineales bacterium]
MPYGYAGKILHLDLSSRTLEIEEPPESFYRQYMGGSAMGLYYILREMPAGLDPLSPQSVITFMVSVTTGAPISGQSRLNVNARSPVSGAIGDSQSGGFFPAELKFAGFDGIVVRGRSDEPVYLSIIEGQPSLHAASHLAGKVTGEVDALLKEEVRDPKAEILQCGPAAENGVLFSSLVSMANRNNGRTGMGLVLASKNLKAIVVRGKRRVEIADKARLVALCRSGPKMMPDNPDVDELGKYGTAGVVMYQNITGGLPTRNFNQGQFEGCEDISGETMFETVLKERDTCYACVVRCKRVVEITEGPYKVDPLYGGPEYETLATFGSYCGVQDLAAISYANEICNKYGVDTISCGATIAFAMECFEKGILDLGDTGGLELHFGDADAMLDVLMQIVTNTGPLGPILSQGSARAARIWGPEAEDCLITVKNQEAPAHMPQAKKSLALIYAANPFGADHQSSEHDPMYEPDAGHLYLARLAQLGLKDPPPLYSLGPEKVRFAAHSQMFYSMLDTLELCQFVWGPAWTLYGPSEAVDFVRAVTGWDVDLAELMEVGERRLNLLRAFNAREGFGRRDDALPKKFFKPLGGKGPTAGTAIDPQELESALDLYYQVLDWTPDGIPTPAKLADLGLQWVAEQLPVAQKGSEHA